MLPENTDLRCGTMSSAMPLNLSRDRLSDIALDIVPHLRSGSSGSISWNCVLGNLFVTVVFVQKEPAKILLENNWLASSKQL